MRSYRGYSTAKGWVTGYYLKYGDSHTITNMNGTFDVDEQTLGVCTGVKHKGNHIYENQVFVSREYGSGIVTMASSGLFYVTFSKASVMLSDFISNYIFMPVKEESIESTKILINRQKQLT